MRGRRRGGSYLVLCAWYVYQDELREIVLPESGEKAVFEDIVVVDDDTDIYASSGQSVQQIE